MSEPAVRAELQITLKDGASAGLKAVEQAAVNSANKTASASVSAANKSVAAAAKAASQSVAAVQAQHDSHIKDYQAIAAARETLGVRPEKTIQREIKQTQEAYRLLARSGTASSRELVRAYDTSISKVKELRNEMGELTKAQRLVQAAQIGAAVTAGAVVAKSVIANPVRSYADLEAAQADLKIALMTQGGKVSASYEEIMRQSTQLGNKLPGATKDFVAAASALKEQGMTESAITGGGLTASAYFGVLANMDQYQSATTIAKMREAYGLGDKDLPAMANLMQKSRYAYGIFPGDFQAVAQYAAPTYNTLGLTGVKNAGELLAVQGMAAGVGLENTSFGTNFAMMLQRTATLDSHVGGKGKEAEEVRQILGEFGIQMNFFTKQGKFAGIENMFAQLEKLKPLSEQDRIRVLTKMFGTEAARPASIMAQKGVAGFQESLAKQTQQADMEERIRMKTSTLSSSEEALSGTWENTKASAASGFGAATKVFADAVNDLLSIIQPGIDKHPGIGTGIITATALGAGAVTTASSLMALQAVMGTQTGMRMISALPGITAAANIASKLPVVPKGAGMFGLAASVGGAVLSSVAGEESTAARYGGAALSGAGLGATVGSLIPVVGTAVGAAVGGIGGMLYEYLSKADKPATMKADLTVGLAPGLVLQHQSVQSAGSVKAWVNTGNLWGIP
ncbi:MAG: phage tail tape measure protein [Gallionella sp.]|nr:phage tail tape measure protein [Gallionella sp.]MDD4947446.1 phage tail tape measure protein [Gallionella sp.]